MASPYDVYRTQEATYTGRGIDFKAASVGRGIGFGLQDPTTPGNDGAAYGGPRYKTSDAPCPYDTRKRWLGTHCSTPGCTAAGQDVTCCLFGRDAGLVIDLTGTGYPPICHNNVCRECGYWIRLNDSEELSKSYAQPWLRQYDAPYRWKIICQGHWPYRLDDFAPGPPITSGVERSRQYI